MQRIVIMAGSWFEPEFFQAPPVHAGMPGQGLAQLLGPVTFTPKLQGGPRSDSLGCL